MCLFQINAININTTHDYCMFGSNKLLFNLLDYLLVLCYGDGGKGSGVWLTDVSASSGETS